MLLDPLNIESFTKGSTSYDPSCSDTFAHRHCTAQFTLGPEDRIKSRVCLRLSDQDEQYCCWGGGGPKNWAGSARERVWGWSLASGPWAGDQL